eukprot:COSAG01_NODE_2223_length_8136_cov_10.727917_12_plen_427_part_00
MGGAQLAALLLLLGTDAASALKCDDYSANASTGVDVCTPCAASCGKPPNVGTGCLFDVMVPHDNRALGQYRPGKPAASAKLSLDARFLPFGSTAYELTVVFGYAQQGGTQIWVSGTAGTKSLNNPNLWTWQLRDTCSGDVYNPQRLNPTCADGNHSLPCALGDLSGKFGTINLTKAFNNSDNIYIDPDLDPETLVAQGVAVVVSPPGDVATSCARVCSGDNGCSSPGHTTPGDEGPWGIPTTCIGPSGELAKYNKLACEQGVLNSNSFAHPLEPICSRGEPEQVITCTNNGEHGGEDEHCGAAGDIVVKYSQDPVIKASYVLSKGAKGFYDGTGVLNTPPPGTPGGVQVHACTTTGLFGNCPGVITLTDKLKDPIDISQPGGATPIFFGVFFACVVAIGIADKLGLWNALTKDAASMPEGNFIMLQ